MWYRQFNYFHRYWHIFWDQYFLMIRILQHCYICAKSQVSLDWFQYREKFVCIIHIIFKGACNQTVHFKVLWNIQIKLFLYQLEWNNIETFLCFIIDYQFVNLISIFSGNRKSNMKCYNMKNIVNLITIISIDHYQTFLTYLK